MASLLEVYRLAVIESLTARDAGIKYGVCRRSLAKMKTKHNLPSLRSEITKKVDNQLSRLNDTQLKSYAEALSLPKNYNTSKREKELVRLELIKRSLSVRVGVTD